MADPNAKPVVTRFAPSPTGALHIGGARTALFNWAFARKHGGRFILRLEDTDQARSSDASAVGIVRDMAWLGLDWDEGPSPKLTAGDDPKAGQIGEHGPYFQSQRLDIYRDHVDRLLKAGHAYEDDGALRLRMAKEPVTFTDAVLGEVTFGPEQLEDFVILKGDGFPTYHLAVVVDDQLMDVTHVIRGQEHLSNTPKHLTLQRLLGFDQPTYAHLSSILNSDGSKMSKRDKAKAARKAAIERLGESPTVPGIDDTAIGAFMSKASDDVRTATAVAGFLGLTLPEIEVVDFRHSGYLPDVLCNYLSLLGWWPADGVERFDLATLVKNFDLDRVSKSNAKFDRAKLAAFNGETLQRMPADEFSRLLKGYMDSRHGDVLDVLGDRFEAFAQAYQPRSQTLNDPLKLGAFFFADDDAMAYDPKAVKKVLTRNDGEGLAALGEIKDVLAGLENWSADAIEAAVKHFCDTREMGMGKVAQPIRVAVTGSTVSPPLGLTLEILGKQATLGRIGRCLSECATAP